MNINWPEVWTLMLGLCFGLLLKDAVVACVGLLFSRSSKTP